MSSFNVRVLDLPTHSRQFDANRQKIRYVSDLLMKSLHSVLKLLSNEAYQNHMLQD